MNAIEILREQHREVLALVRKINQGRDLDERPMLVDTLVGQLRVHTSLEERIFYPAIARADRRTEEMVLESYEEHRLVDVLLAQLPTMDLASDLFEARARVLQSLLEEHIEEEEEVLFERAQALGEDELVALGKDIERDLAEVSRVNELLDRAAAAAKRTERWAGRLLDFGLVAPRRAVSALAPSRIFGLDRRGMLVAALAERIPRWIVDGVYERIVGDTNGKRYRPETESARRMAQATDVTA
ncbi:MAG TPA: hemerythrin domain-containing protein [Candidatus Binatia bacterium]|nr:hemerythrin domain-containing protein [Candidatus Binatia bacterium]